MHIGRYDYVEVVQRFRIVLAVILKVWVGEFVSHGTTIGHSCDGSYWIQKFSWMT